jgi:hypothetical protein
MREIKSQRMQQQKYDAYSSLSPMLVIQTIGLSAEMRKRLRVLRLCFKVDA